MLLRDVNMNNVDINVYARVSARVCVSVCVCVPAIELCVLCADGVVA